MIQNDKVPIFSIILQWRCVESKVNNECFHYGLFAISPFRSGQANTIGNVVHKTQFGRVEKTCITCAKSEKITHEYSTILGIKKLMRNILINLKKIVLKSKSNS